LGEAKRRDLNSKNPPPLAKLRGISFSEGRINAVPTKFFEEPNKKGATKNYALH